MVKGRVEKKDHRKGARHDRTIKVRGFLTTTQIEIKSRRRGQKRAQRRTAEKIAFPEAARRGGSRSIRRTGGKKPNKSSRNGEMTPVRGGKKEGKVGRLLKGKHPKDQD